MLRTIHLHGEMRERFGGPFRLSVATPQEAARALACQIRGFREYLLSGHFHIVRGASLEEGIGLDADMVRFRIGNADLHFVPVLAGAKSGAFKVVAGLAIIAVSVAAAAPGVAAANAAIAANATTPVEVAAGYAGTGIGLGLQAGLGITYGQFAAFGLMMALGGVAQILSPNPTAGNYGDRNPVDQRPSDLYNGAVNVTEQGGPVPLLYGRMIVGSTVISSALDVSQE